MRDAVLPLDAEAPRVLTAAVAEAARRLDVGSTRLARIIGTSQPTASRLLNGRYTLSAGAKSWELALQFVRLYRSLASLVGGDDALARAWLTSANRAFDDAVPLALIQRVDGLVHACDYLDAHRAPV